MKVSLGPGTLTLDRSLCIASGQCVLATDGVFDQDDDDGLVKLNGGSIPGNAVESVRKAVDGCPSGALRYDGPN